MISSALTRAISLVGRIIQDNKSSIFRAGQAATSLQLVRHRTNKHWLPKWKRLRKQKVIKVKLPNYHEKEGDISQEEMRSRLKEKGIYPVRHWMERPITISCTTNIFEPYVPPEGDGKFSAISKTGASQKVEFVKKKGTSTLAIRKIKKFESDFDSVDFEDKSKDIYIKAHEALTAKDKIALRTYVTEKAYTEMTHNTRDKIIHWKYLESLAPPRLVHARCTHIITEDNVFAQVTVRLHSQQMLAVYDRFGRLMHGSEILRKDVLEYIVFEKHIANEYGLWRIHGKIIPPWMPPSDEGQRTYIQKPPPQTEEKIEVPATQ